jgi:hypothetical protein
LTTTQCMKEYRTPSQSVVKEPGRRGGRPYIAGKTQFVYRLPPALTRDRLAKLSCPPSLFRLSAFAPRVRQLPALRSYVGQFSRFA